MAEIGKLAEGLLSAVPKITVESPTGVSTTDASMKPVSMKSGTSWLDNKWVFLMAGVGILGLVAAVAFVLYQRKKKHEQDESKEQSKYNRGVPMYHPQPMSPYGPMNGSNYFPPMTEEQRRQMAVQQQQHAQQRMHAMRQQSVFNTGNRVPSPQSPAIPLQPVQQNQQNQQYQPQQMPQIQQQIQQPQLQQVAYQPVQQQLQEQLLQSQQYQQPIQPQQQMQFQPQPMQSQYPGVPLQQPKTTDQFVYQEEQLKPQLSEYASVDTLNQPQH